MHRTTKWVGKKERLPRRAQKCASTIPSLGEPAEAAFAFASFLSRQAGIGHNEPICPVEGRGLCPD